MLNFCTKANSTTTEPQPQPKLCSALTQKRLCIPPPNTETHKRKMKFYSPQQNTKLTTTTIVVLKETNW